NVQREESNAKVREIFTYIRNVLNTNRLAELGGDGSVTAAARRLVMRGGSAARTVQLLDRILKDGERGSYRMVDALTSIARTPTVNLSEDSVETVIEKVRARDPRAA